MVVCDIHIVLVVNVVVIESDGIWRVQLTAYLYGVTVQGMIGDKGIIDGIPLWDGNLFIFRWGVVQCRVPWGWGWCLEILLIVWFTDVICQR